MTIVNKPTEELKPYDKNAKKHDKKQIANVAESIKQFGFVQPIVLDKDNNVIIGHCRLEAAKKLHLDEVPCVMADDLTDEQVKKLRLLDNKLNESEWDIDLIAEEIADLDFDGFDVDWGLKKDEENPYTSKINIPQYEVSGELPTFGNMYDTEKTEILIAEINNSNVTEAEKKFLIEAAHRHCVFDYRNIAEYYAQATREMQELMEKSALVIIDYDNAIANGYVKLSERLKRLSEYAG